MIKTIFYNITRILTGNILAAFIAFFVNVFLINNTSAIISSEVLHFYSSILIVATVIEFGLANYIISRKLDDDNNILVAFIVTCLTFIVFSFPLHFLLNVRVDVIVVGYFYANIRVFLGVYQSRKKFVQYSLMNITQNALRLFALFYLVYVYKNNLNSREIELAFSVAILINLLIGVYIYFNKLSVNREHREQINYKCKVKMFIFGCIYYVIINTINIVIMRGEPILIAKFLDIKFVSEYMAANTLALLIPIMTGSIVSVLLPYFSSGEINRSILIKIQLTISLFVMIGMALLYFLSELIFNMFYGNANFIIGSKLYFYLSSIYLISAIFTPLEGYSLMKSPSINIVLKLLQIVLYMLAFIITIEHFGLYAIIIASLLCRIPGWVYYSYTTYSKNSTNVLVN